MVRRRASVFPQLFRKRAEPFTEADQRDAVRRAEAKKRAATEATQGWLTLMRELEESGESGGPTYQSYYTAYLGAREQEKRVELELFNARQGLRK